MSLQKVRRGLTKGLAYTQHWRRKKLLYNSSLPSLWARQINRKSLLITQVLTSLTHLLPIRFSIYQEHFPIFPVTLSNIFIPSVDPMQSATSFSPSAPSPGTPPSITALSPAAELVPTATPVVTPPAMLSGLTTRLAGCELVPRAPTGVRRSRPCAVTPTPGASSKPTLANAREKVQAAFRQSPSPLKRKFDDDDNEEELYRPKKKRCNIIPTIKPWKRGHEVLRVMKLGEPGRLALLASTYSSASSRAQLVKPGEPEMSREEVQAAVRQSPSLWERKKTPRPAKLSRFEERTAWVKVYAPPTDPDTTFHPTKQRRLERWWRRNILYGTSSGIFIFRRTRLLEHGNGVVQNFEFWMFGWGSPSATWNICYEGQKNLYLWPFVLYHGTSGSRSRLLVMRFFELFPGGWRFAEVVCVARQNSQIGNSRPFPFTYLSHTQGSC